MYTQSTTIGTDWLPENVFFSLLLLLLLRLVFFFLFFCFALFSALSVYPLPNFLPIGRRRRRRLLYLVLQPTMAVAPLRRWSSV